MALRVLAVMPARYGSSRLPGKPLREILDIPLIVYAMQSACCPCKLCTERRPYDFIVATDDEHVAEAVMTFRPDVEVAITSHELESGTDRMAAVAEMLKADGREYDLYVNIQGDQVFINPHVWVDPLIKAMEANPDLDMATPIANVPYVSEGFTRSCTWMHVGVYAYRPEALQRYYDARKLKRPRKREIEQSLEQCRAVSLGFNIGKVHIRAMPPIECNTEDDLSAIHWIVCQTCESLEVVLPDDEQPDEQPDTRTIN